MRNFINIVLLVFLFSFLGRTINAFTPTGTQFKILLRNFDYNKDGMLSWKELPVSLWSIYGKYDFNRDGKLSEKEFFEKRIPPGIKK